MDVEFDSWFLAIGSCRERRKVTEKPLPEPLWRGILVSWLLSPWNERNFHTCHRVSNCGQVDRLQCGSFPAMVVCFHRGLAKFGVSVLIETFTEIR